MKELMKEERKGGKKQIKASLGYPGEGEALGWTWEEPSTPWAQGRKGTSQAEESSLGRKWTSAS